MEILGILIIFSVVIVMYANRSERKEKEFYKDTCVKLLERSGYNKVAAQRLLDRERMTSK